MDFLKSASRLLPDGWVGFTSFDNRCHFRAFQIELDTLGTKNFGIGPVVKELQVFEVGRILENSGESETFRSGFGGITVHLGFRVGFGKIRGNTENVKC